MLVLPFFDEFIDNYHKMGDAFPLCCLVQFFSCGYLFNISWINIIHFYVGLKKTAFFLAFTYKFFRINVKNNKINLHLPSVIGECVLSVFRMCRVPLLLGLCIV